MNRRILKVKREKDKKTSKYIKIHVEYTQKNLAGGTDELVLICPEEPLPSLHAAFDALAECAIMESELTSELIPRTKVSSVSFSYGGEKEVMGAVITASVKMLHANCPLNINTPHKPSAPYTDNANDETPCLDDHTIDCLLALMDETNKYLDGERLQMKLDLEVAGKAITVEAREVE